MKKIISLLSLGLVSMGAWAQVSIGETTYSTLNEAYDAAVDGDVIVVTENQTINNSITAKVANITIKGEGNVTLTAENNVMLVVPNTAGAMLSLENFTIDCANTSKTVVESKGTSATSLSLKDITFSNYSGAGIGIQTKITTTLENVVFDETCTVGANHQVFIGANNKTTLSGICKFELYLESTNYRVAGADLAAGSSIDITIEVAKRDKSFCVSGCTDLSMFHCASEGWYLNKQTSGNDVGIHIRKAEDCTIVNTATTHSFSTLADALGALYAEENTIELKDNCAISGNRIDVIGKNVTVEGVGENITISRDKALDKAMLLSKDKAVVTVKNVTFDGTGLTNNDTQMIECASGASLNLENVTFANRTGKGIKAQGTVVLTDVKAVNCTMDEATQNLLVFACKNCKLTVAGSTSLGIKTEETQNFRAQNLTEDAHIDVLVGTISANTLVNGWDNPANFTILDLHEELELVAENGGLVIRPVENGITIKLNDGENDIDIVDGKCDFNGLKSNTLKLEAGENYSFYYKFDVSGEGDAEESPAVFNAAAHTPLEGFTAYSEPIVVDKPGTLSYYAVHTTGATTPVRTVDFTVMTGVENVAAESAAPAEYFTLQGMRVAAPEAGQVYIVRRGNATSKVRF